MNTLTSPLVGSAKPRAPPSSICARLMDARRSPPSWRSPAAPPPPTSSSERASSSSREQSARRFSSHEHAAARTSAETDKRQQRRSISGHSNSNCRTIDGERDESSRARRESFHNAVAATSDSADLTAYYAFSRRRASSVSVICDEGGRSASPSLSHLDVRVSMCYY